MRDTSSFFEERVSLEKEGGERFYVSVEGGATASRRAV